MNIIEAIQEAEAGALITNHFLKSIGHFMKYVSGGVFFEYEIVNGKANYKYEVRDFSMSDVISHWEVMSDNDYFIALAAVRN